MSIKKQIYKALILLKDEIMGIKKKIDNGIATDTEKGEFPEILLMFVFSMKEFNKEYSNTKPINNNSMFKNVPGELMIIFKNIIEIANYVNINIDERRRFAQEHIKLLQEAFSNNNNIIKKNNNVKLTLEEMIKKNAHIQLIKKIKKHYQQKFSKNNIIKKNINVKLTQDEINNKNAKENIKKNIQQEFSNNNIIKKNKNIKNNINVKLTQDEMIKKNAKENIKKHIQQEFSNNNIIKKNKNIKKNINVKLTQDEINNMSAANRTRYIMGLATKNKNKK